MFIRVLFEILHKDSLELDPKKNVILCENSENGIVLIISKTISLLTKY